MFVADTTTRIVHRVSGRQPDNCCLGDIAESDRVVLEDEAEARRMIELEAYEPCPACMAAASRV